MEYTRLNRTMVFYNLLILNSMTQYADSGNYTCLVENAHGRDEVTYGVEVKVPPQPPVLAVVDSFADSLHLQWSDQGDGGSPILGTYSNDLSI